MLHDTPQVQTALILLPGGIAEPLRIRSSVAVGPGTRLLWVIDPMFAIPVAWDLPLLYAGWRWFACKHEEGDVMAGRKVLFFFQCCIGIAGLHAASALAQGAKVDVCHVPPGNP